MKRITYVLRWVSGNLQRSTRTSLVLLPPHLRLLVSCFLDLQLKLFLLFLLPLTLYFCECFSQQVLVEIDTPSYSPDKMHPETRFVKVENIAGCGMWFLSPLAVVHLLTFYFSESARHSSAIQQAHR
jgi:hypothetical protein